MIKNILIIFMVFSIVVLLKEKPDNMEILKNSFFSAKEIIENNYNSIIKNNWERKDLKNQEPESWA